MMSSVSPGYQLLLITPSMFSNVYDVVCVTWLSITLDYHFGVSIVLYVCVCYQLPFISSSVFSNVYDVVCVSRLSITLDYLFGVL